MRLILTFLMLVTLVIPAVADEVDDLIFDLKDENWVVQMNAATALSEIGEPAVYSDGRLPRLLV